MRQPRLVLTARLKLRANGVCRRGTGRLAMSRPTDERAPQPAELGPQHAVAKRPTIGGARSAPLADTRRVNNACNLPRSAGRLGHRPCRRVAELGRACEWQCPRQRCQPQSGGRSGVLAPLLLSARVVAALASPLVVTITARRAGRPTVPARSPHSMAAERRARARR